VTLVLGIATVQTQIGVLWLMVGVLFTLLALVSGAAALHQWATKHITDALRAENVVLREAVLELADACDIKAKVVRILTNLEGK
jgi:hypothetical protein